MQLQQLRHSEHLKRVAMHCGHWSDVAVCHQCADAFRLLVAGQLGGSLTYALTVMGGGGNLVPGQGLQLHVAAKGCAWQLETAISCMER